MINAKQAAEFAEVHLDLNSADISQIKDPMENKMFTIN
jgi:hypothetical protein